MEYFYVVMMWKQQCFSVYVYKQKTFGMMLEQMHVEK